MRVNPLLSVSDLRVTFATPSGPLEAVRGISFDLHRGETLALVGESGSGKSVTALSVLQLLPYPGAWHPSGSIRFEGRELVGAPEEALQKVRGDRIAMIFQEPMTSLNPLHRVEKQISETLMLHKGATAGGARTRTLELLQLVGIKDPEGRLSSYPHELSGGERQRVMIAMALANDPDILIADEPTTALDVTIQAQILALLKELQAEFGMAMLLITHDLGIVRKVSDRVCVMTNGEIVETDSVERIFAAPAHPYTQHLLAAEPTGDPPTPRADSQPVMQSQDLRVWFPIKRGVIRRTVAHLKAVEGVSLTLREGETLGVVGESGSGKTTLGLALLRL
ncbi:MAG: ABC transporter ATP-binding protein, partial [Myxococcales bacterium]|nr:ABC transporter ATP-binding protein [Myxococcales bacterium]